MRKVIAILFFVGSIFSLKAQDLEKVLADKMCKCFSENNDMDIFRDAEKCANKETAKDAVLWYYKNKGDKVSQDEIQKKINELDYSGDHERLIRLLYSCDSFLDVIEKGRESQISKFRRLRSKEYLDSINNRALIIKESLRLRSQLNFGYGNYDVAEKDLEKIEKLYGLDRNGYIALAWVYEKK